MDAARMTNIFPARHRPLAPLFGLACVLLAGCQKQPLAPPSARVYAVDLAGGARSCTVPAVELTEGKSAAAAMSVANDGGWCAITLAQRGRQPYAAGLIQTRAQHGQVHIHTVGYDTRIDYTPDSGFNGTDAFAVRLIPGNPVLTVNVTVTPK
jgi:hypothetical protein